MATSSKIGAQRNGNRFSVAIRVPIDASGYLHEIPLVNDTDGIVVLYRNDHGFEYVHIPAIGYA
jgi:hypothetical protein